MAATKTKVQDINPEVVRKVKTAEGWLEVQGFEVVPSGVTVGGVSLGDSVKFTVRDGSKRVLPATAVIEVEVGDPQQEARDKAEREQRQRDRGEAVFAFVHYATREEFDRQVGEQGGVCASCRGGLAGMVHAHMDPDGLVRCPTCSVLKVRYGNQMPDVLNRQG